MSISVKINEKFKSINPCEFVLPGFCVLTGKNGSGKSHLLEAIASIQKKPKLSSRGLSEPYSISIVKDGQNKFKSIRLIQFGQLIPSVVETCEPSEIVNFVKQAFELYRKNKAILKVKVSIPHSDDRHKIDFLKYVNEEISDDQKELTETDLFNNIHPKFLAQDDLLAGKFALIFKNYQNLVEKNAYAKYRKEIGEYVGEVLTDQEFIKKYNIPPWEIINQIFDRLDIPYMVNDPRGDDIEASFTLQLIDKSNGTVRIKCNDLSTGEKILLSLAMAIYNSDSGSIKPDLLLIDEPDAGLHPSMSSSVISVIKEFIVEKSNIPVIITTHSPTTIAALNDDDAIYEKKRNSDACDNSIPHLVTKAEALSVLTADIPFLSVSVEDRRAVFVESEYDAEIYSRIYDVFKEKIQAKPNFFPLFKRKENGSNCDDVISQVNNFDKCGDSQVYGIVDWDGKNEQKDRLLVLGFGDEARYSIENFILDPLLVGLLLIVTQKRKFSDFNIEHLNSYLAIREITCEDAQLVIDGVLLMLNKHEEELIEYTTCNNWKLKTAKSIVMDRGHSLEQLYKDRIPELQMYKSDSQAQKNLKLQVIDKIVREIPGLMPKALLDTLVSIQ